MPTGFICELCGKYHDIEMSFAADVPDLYAQLSVAERDARATLSSDLCAVDGKYFFVRCCVEIPIRESKEVFLWGVWVSVFERDYDEIAEAAEEEGREKKFGPYKGRLANGLREYPGSLNLKVTVRVQPVGVRPLAKIDEEHALAREQAEGITRKRATEMASQIFHDAGVRHFRTV